MRGINPEQGCEVPSSETRILSEESDLPSSQRSRSVNEPTSNRAMERHDPGDDRRFIPAAPAAPDHNPDQCNVPKPTELVIRVWIFGSGPPERDDGATLVAYGTSTPRLLLAPNIPKVISAHLWSPLLAHRPKLTTVTTMSV